MGQTDDSDDGSMRDLLREVQRLHLEACRAARPAPGALARMSRRGIPPKSCGGAHFLITPVLARCLHRAEGTNRHIIDR